MTKFNDSVQMSVQRGAFYFKAYATRYEIDEIGTLEIFDGDDVVIVCAPGAWDSVKINPRKENRYGDE